MKLVVVAFSFVIFIFSVSSLEIDPTDDRTIEYFLAQFFEGEDPSTFKNIETEVKKHSSELLSGFLSLVGDSFDFDASDMKTQLKKLAQDFDVENLIKVVEDIFGIGSVVVSQLQKNSGEVKDKITAFIDSLVSEFVSTRKKRANEDRPEILLEIDCNPKLENDSEENKWIDVPEIQQDQFDKKEDHRVLNNVPHVKQNGHKTKRTDFITPGVKSRKDAVVNDNAKPSVNGGPETELPHSKIPRRIIQKSDNEKYQHDTTTQKRISNKGFLYTVIPDSNKPKDDGRDILIEDGTFVKGQLDSVKTETENQEENEDNHEIEIDENDKNKEKWSEARENFRKLGDLSQELLEEMVDIAENRKEQWKNNVLKAREAIKEYIDSSKDRTLDIFNIYGSFLFDILEKEKEKIRTIFKY